MERAVSEARAKAEEEFNEKIERFERETRSKEREVRKEIRLLKSKVRENGGSGRGKRR